MTKKKFEFEFGEDSENEGSLGSKCPKCNKGELEYDEFELEGKYYKVNCTNEDCNAQFWETEKSVDAWGEIVN